MAMKSVILLITTLLALVFVTPQANAIIVNVGGTVLCPLNATVNLNVTTNITLPPLPIVNARVQANILNIPIGVAVSTDGAGRFVLSFVQSVLTAIGNLLNLITINVTPPPGACNGTLPVNAILQSVPPLQLTSQSILSIRLNVTALKIIQIT